MSITTSPARLLHSRRLASRRWIRGGRGSWRLGSALTCIVVGVIVVGLVRGGSDTMHLSSALQAPSWAHPFGTDPYGRDQLARVAEGGVRSLSAAMLVLLISVVSSLIIGTSSALIGGPLDTVISRIIDVLLAVPGIVLALGITGAFGPGFLHLVFALSVAYIAVFSRMTRAFAIASRHRDDVVAARLAGVPWWKTVVGHVIPGVATQLAVIATLALGDIIISIAGLSFLGLGIKPPAAEWGSMLQDSRSSFGTAPWLLVIPAVTIILTVAAANLLADSLRESHK